MFEGLDFVFASRLSVCGLGIVGDGAFPKSLGAIGMLCTRTSCWNSIH